MGIAITALGANCQMGLGSSLSLDPTKVYALIAWDDIKGSINSSAVTPNSLEDILAALDFRKVDLTTGDTNSSGQKLTAGRRFVSIDNGRGIDEKQFESDKILSAYSVLTVYYIEDSNPSRPPASSL